MADIIIIYLGTFPPKSGFSGADRRVHALSKSIALTGINTTLVAPTYNNTDGIKTKELFTIEYIGKVKKSSITTRLLFWWSLFRYIRKNKTKYIILYSPILDSVPFILLMRSLRVKIALEMCDLQSSSITGVLHYFWKYGEILAPKVVNFNILISDYLERFVTQNTKTSIVRVPVLVDLELFSSLEASGAQFREEYHFKADDILVFYMGGMWKDEGVDNLLKAILLIDDVRVKLVLAGRIEKNAPLHVDVDGFIKENGLESRIYPLGYLNTADMKKALSAADITCIPQIKSDFNRAGLPTKSAEYAAAGKAILATNVGDIGKYFEHLKNAYLIEDSTAPIIADAITFLVNNDIKRKELGDSALLTATKMFSLKENGIRIVKAFENNDFT